MSADSCEQNDASSYARPFAGFSVSRSCCWHHTVGFPSTRIWHLSTQSSPFSNALRHFSRRSAPSASIPSAPSAASRISSSTLRIALSLNVMCVQYPFVRWGNCAQPPFASCVERSQSTPFSAAASEAASPFSRWWRTR